MLELATPPHRHRSVRLDTLVRLRWFSIAGQTAAVLVVEYGLDFDFPFWACLAVIALSTWLNIGLRLRFYPVQRLDPDRVAWLLAFDIAELAVLLFLSGGLQNPFAFLFLSPVLISATALPPRYTLTLGGFAVTCATALVFLHYPLPWDAESPLELPPIYMMGVWLSILLSLGFISVYAWQVTEESRKLANALAAAELALTREQSLSQLDGLAAAAAHELGTPLSTISTVAKELERAIDGNSPYADDVKLLREQASRCRDILGKLTALSSTGEPFDRVTLSALIEDVVAPHRNFGIAIEVAVIGNDGGEPVGTRNPAVLYGLGNIIENAVDFANDAVSVTAVFDADRVEIKVSDDGPGLAPDIIQRIGEPYVTTRPRDLRGEDETTGLGLGIFIAKTLLERSGASLEFGNRKSPEHGAAIKIAWTRADFEDIGGFAAI